MESRLEDRGTRVSGGGGAGIARRDGFAYTAPYEDITLKGA